MEKRHKVTDWAGRTYVQAHGNAGRQRAGAGRGETCARAAPSFGRVALPALVARKCALRNLRAEENAHFAQRPDQVSRCPIQGRCSLRYKTNDCALSSCISVFRGFSPPSSISGPHPPRAASNWLPTESDSPLQCLPSGSAHALAPFLAEACMHPPDSPTEPPSLWSPQRRFIM
jgi:hypothetical protein